MRAYHSRLRSSTLTTLLFVEVPGTTGFAVMMASYYEVNIAYLKSTLFFYQKAFLGITENSGKDDKVSS